MDGLIKSTVLVVDDDPSIVKILRGYLEQAGFTVFSAYQGREAMTLLHHERPDLVLLDVMLPDLDGWEFTRQVRADARVAATPILMLTARVEDTDKIIGLEMGADDYITKPFNAREVVARVRAMLRRRQLDQMPAPKILRVGELALDQGQRVVTLRDEPIELTPTEYRLLEILMQNPGHTFTRDELLEAGLGYGYEGFGRTLDTHIANLRKKIEPNPKDPTYILTVYSVGYRMARS